MNFPALYQDGMIADDLKVVCRPEGEMLAICDPVTDQPVAHWNSSDLFTMASRKGTLRIACKGHRPGARLIVEDAEAEKSVRTMLPSLGKQRMADKMRQLRLITVSVVALVALVAGYIAGVPLLANRVVAAVSPDWETDLGETVDAQLGQIFGDGQAIELCDPKPGSIANTAIAEFAERALEGVDTPFDIRIGVLASDIPNAFALPGGRIYYFNGLLRETQDGDEFAGVLAHEIGHVIYRHGLEQLIASAGTGLLVGFVLGDVTGISVAGALGSLVIDSHFSREHELQADAFAHEVAHRIGFNPSAMADLLERVSQDDNFTRAMALLSTHPLTEDRRTLLERYREDMVYTGAFTGKQWYAISQMCGDRDVEIEQGS